MSDIVTIDKPNCPVCNASGVPLYNNLIDELFGSEGLWNIQRCSEKICSTLWLNPAPVPSELHKLYEHYSTHQDEVLTSPTASSFLTTIRHSYLHKKFGYPFPASWMQIFAYLHPTWRDTQEANIFYMPHKQDGKLLDIGCGAGSAMQVLQTIGWKTVGIDFDEKAIENAKRKELDARVGDVFSQHFEQSSFDAILMNHVIEHVPNPKEVMEECRRILRPGGILVVLTPNAKSRGHSCYGRYWRGLETPRHLQLFSVGSLRHIAEQSRFEAIKSFSSTQGILNIYDASRARKNTGSFDIPAISSFPQKLIYHIRWFFFGVRRALIPNKDEVAVIICQK